MYVYAGVGLISIPEDVSSRVKPISLTEGFKALKQQVMRSRERESEYERKGDTAGGQS